MLREIDFLLSNFAYCCDFGDQLLWKQICGTLNHHTVMKIEPSPLIPRELAANLFNCWY